MPRTSCRSQHLILVPELLSDSSSIQEILRNLNPHFYEDLPILRVAHWTGKIDPTNGFRRANKFYVLTDQVSQSFGKVCCSKTFMIFKGSGISPAPIDDSRRSIAMLLLLRNPPTLYGTIPACRKNLINRRVLTGKLAGVGYHAITRNCQQRYFHWNFA